MTNPCHGFLLWSPLRRLGNWDIGMLQNMSEMGIEHRLCYCKTCVLITAGFNFQPLCQLQNKLYYLFSWTLGGYNLKAAVPQCINSMTWPERRSLNIWVLWDLSMPISRNTGKTNANTLAIYDILPIVGP